MKVLKGGLIMQWTRNINLAFIILSLFFTFELHAKNTIIIVRHGQGEHNIGNFYNADMSHANYRISNLTDKGRKEALNAARKLDSFGYAGKIDLVFVSPLPRTIQTAKIISSYGIYDSSLEIIEPRLVEVKTGNREGLPHEDGKDSWDHSDGRSHGGETGDDVRERVGDLLNELSSKYENMNILLVTHGTPASELISLVSKVSDVRLKTAEIKFLDIS
jgi:broad specificity phosphatase PhoE